MKHCLGFARPSWSVLVSTAALLTLTIAPAQAAGAGAAPAASVFVTVGPAVQADIHLRQTLPKRPIRPTCGVCIL